MCKSLINGIFFGGPSSRTARKYLFRPSRPEPLARLRRCFDRHRPSVLTTGQDSRAKTFRQGSRTKTVVTKRAEPDLISRRRWRPSHPKRPGPRQGPLLRRYPRGGFVVRAKAVMSVVAAAAGRALPRQIHLR